MKRALIDSRQSAIVREESKARRKYKSLLRDFLDVQKEFVSKKRKLQVLRQRRETLAAEVGFLRRRHGYLQNLQNRKHGLENLPMALERKQNLQDGVEEEEALTEDKSQNNGSACLGDCFCKPVRSSTQPFKITENEIFKLN